MTSALGRLFRYMFLSGALLVHSLPTRDTCYRISTLSGLMAIRRDGVIVVDDGSNPNNSFPLTVRIPVCSDESAHAADVCDGRSIYLMEVTSAEYKATLTQPFSGRLFLSASCDVTDRNVKVQSYNTGELVRLEGHFERRAITGYPHSFRLIRVATSSQGAGKSLNTCYIGVASDSTVAGVSKTTEPFGVDPLNNSASNSEFDFQLEKTYCT